MNFATEYLRANHETVYDWSGCCGELVSKLEQDGDGVIYIECPLVGGRRECLENPRDSRFWRYHMVLLRDGLVHDAWCKGPALPVREWLVKMFGKNLSVEVSLNGDIIFTGLTQDFEFNEACS